LQLLKEIYFCGPGVDEVSGEALRGCERTSKNAENAGDAERFLSIEFK